MRVLRRLLSFPKTNVERTAIVLGCLILLLALVGAFLVPFDPMKIDFRAKLQAPSMLHWLGTDGSGRDVLSRLLYGARLTLASTFAVIIVVVIIGCTIGIASAFVGGAVDNMLMRLADIWLGFPPLILALGFASALGASLEAAIWALIFSWWPNYARLSRMVTADILSQKFIASADALGVPTHRKVLHYVIPNAMDVMLIQIALDISAVMLAISGLSFIGVGAQIPAPEWGAMIADGRSYVSNGWWIVLAPGIAIFITAVSFNVIGDMLRRELDPTSRRR
ncbi:peptide/nickel transport system permease protein [Kaistia soli DSM 19436]|uniref:Peptide/nickel transport system permease protein n=1 Tax=Kaistia soli DSM 19436 TaxID=1122133 RepID=A0A1M5E7I1_9HYPH|nr:ABC transporter permease [Kaistia soli]SHF75094.1 peptide/nickel transport system permease protein [Kaistia soli DSM 19436]